MTVHTRKGSNMLDKNTEGFSAPLTCKRDQGMQRLVPSERAVPFLRIGGVARIEVVGIPALECQVCYERLYDLDVLARIENALQRYVAEGHRCKFWN
jgi:hypothetical protein